MLDKILNWNRRRKGAKAWKRFEPERDKLVTPVAELQHGFNKIFAESDAWMDLERDRKLVEANHLLGRTAEQIAAEWDIDLRFVIDEIERIEAAK